MRSKIKILIIIIFVFTACNSKPYYKFDQDAKDYFIFKEGSWWLYENEQTHERDCLYISEHEIYEKSFGNDDRSYYIDRYQTIFSSNDSAFRGDGMYYSGIIDITHISENILFKNLILYFALDFPSLSYEKDILYTRNNITNEGYSKVECNNNNIYHEDFRTKSQNDTIFYTALTKIWRERYKGMTKFYVKNDTAELTFNIIDYNVIQ